MFNGKKILFIAPIFFGYSNEISSKLRELGASVDFFDERPSNSFFVKASLRINKNLIKPIINRYYLSIFTKTKRKEYDFVFIIDPEAINEDILKELRMQQPRAKFLLYLWDSIVNKKGRRQLFKHIDKVYSFDRFDCLSDDKIIFRPLFFTDKFLSSSTDNNNDNYDYIIAFIGTIHSDRFKIIKQVLRIVESYKFKVFLFMYIQGKRMYFYRKFIRREINGASVSDFSYTPLSKNEIVSIIKRTKCILDIQHPSQTGLTMRTLEALGSQKKLITTNADIINYNFYNSNNILVIDRKDKDANMYDFLIRTYQPISSEIVNMYSLEGWLNEIFL